MSNHASPADGPEAEHVAGGGAATSAGARGWRQALAIAGVLLPAVAVLGVLAFGFTREARYIASPLLGRPAPAFILPLLDGGVLRLEDLRGKVVVLNFWASWCPPCRAEARALEAVWRKHRDLGVVLVGANIQDQDADARAFVEEFAITYPNGVDRGSKIAIDYGVWGLPETFIIGREGRIIYKHVGGVAGETLAGKLEKVLRGVESPSEGRGDYRPVLR